MIPLITRRSSTRGNPRGRAKNGSIPASARNLKLERKLKREKNLILILDFSGAVLRRAGFWGAHLEGTLLLTRRHGRGAECDATRPSDEGAGAVAPCTTANDAVDYCPLHVGAPLSATCRARLRSQ
jgi:hypothetical protein